MLNYRYMGRWTPQQQFAVVAKYREQGRSAEWVAAKLKAKLERVERMYAILAQRELDEQVPGGLPPAQPPERASQGA